tara:strand:- start:359 stop:712 length:354 start_codon:yes stop_codon:yes gene_type:complete
MSGIVLYHNPNCSKSRGALSILEASDAAFEVVPYLDTPLDRDTLLKIIKLLPNDPAALVRKDKNFKDLGLHAANYTSAEAVADLLVEHPKLMQRPIAVKDDQAVIGRPSENVEALLD